MNERDMLPILMGEFNDTLKRLPPIVPRTAQFAPVPNKIKVAIGMRRSGKTYFLYQAILQLLAQDIPLSQILYLNFEDDRLLPLTSEKLARLLDAFYSTYPKNYEEKCYLFLDEIQNVEDWPIVIRRFYDSKNVEIFLTGSSAKLLSKEIATSLRGRSLSVEIWPYSFGEFATAKNEFIDISLYDNKTKDNVAALFHQYLQEGGFPEVVAYSPETRQQTLQDYVDVVIYRDIVERYNLSNAAAIKYMILTMIHNVSSPFSINKFFNDLKSQGYRISKDILYEYANYIEDAYLAFSVPIFTESIRKVQSNPKKIYAIDPGLIRALTLNFTSNFGRLFENLIYLDLRRRGHTIYYYLTAQRYEVDFLVQNSKGEKKLLQVVWDMKDQDTASREVRALQQAQNELGIPGYIVTLESYLKGDIEL